VDLIHEPLVVGPGGPDSIEITMSDDGGKIEGKVESSDGSFSEAVKNSAAAQATSPESFYVYCIPLAGSSGQFTEGRSLQDGRFTFWLMPPGTYRVLAFQRQQSELEYRNPEAMKAYDGKGQVVHIEAGKTEHLQLPLITSNE
jgi:hypothetical protein